ncbi:MAG: hypothetical protein ABIJ09_08075 [Pseudomonadota bacterium]
MTRLAMPSFRVLLALLVSCGLVQLAPMAATTAQASSLMPLADLGAAVAGKRKKKAKKKKAKKKKKKDKAPTPPAAVPSTSVAILPFDGDGGGQTMAGQVQGAITTMAAADGYQMDIALAPGSGRYQPPSVKAAMAATGAHALVRGMGVRDSDRVEVKVFAYSPDGVLRFAKLYTAPPGEVDALALAPAIARDLDGVLPTLASRPPVTGADAEPLALPAPTPVVTTPTPTTTTTPAPAKTEPTSTENTARSTPLFAIGLGFDTLYWSYDLHSAQLVSTVNWHPLDPYFGGSLNLALWPIEWVGVDLAVHGGLRSYSVDLPVDQSEISLTALSAELNLRGRYVFGFGVGVGAHLGYRYDGSFVSEQTPVVVAPGFGAHQVSPGLDLYITALAPLLSARLSADVVPWGLYGESPDQPGASASMWGWRVDGALRSTFFMGIFAELRLFYGNSYVTYSGAGKRTNFDGAAITDGEVVNGLRGLSLGLGWSL